MGDKRIIYGGSKAIKVTSDMKKGLNSYVKTTQDFDSSSLELNTLEQTINNKNNELETLKTKESSGDNKEAKEASKQIKNLEKDLEKLETDIDKTRVKVQELEEKKNKPQLEGTTFKTLAALEQIINPAEVNTPTVENTPNEEATPTNIENNTPEIPIVNEMDNVQQSTDNQSAVTNATEAPQSTDLENNINTPIIDSIIPEVPVVDDIKIEENSDVSSPELGKPEENQNDNVIPEIPSDENIIPEVPTENVFDTEIKEEPIIPEENEEVGTTEENQNDSVIPEIPDDETPEEKSILDSMGDEAEEPASNQSEEENGEIGGDILISELEEDIPDEEVIESEEKDDSKESNNNDSGEFDFDSLTTADLERIWEELHKDKSGIESPGLEDFNENDKFAPIVKELTSFEEDTDISNLTQFNEYNDYVFAYGQKLYGKEALTPKEIETLDQNDDFLDEKDFLNQRNSQYHDISRENEKIKQEITVLGEEYQKNIDSMSEKYTKGINELNEALEEAKNKINILLTQKTQFERLNKSLSETANEQSQKIEELTNANKGLQDTIVNQSGKIANLENNSEEQAQKMTELEDKLNKVFGIVKDEIDK